jgi:hypothetical protein
VELEKFRINPEGYIPSEVVEVVPPHILIAGVRGSGVQTFVGMLQGRYEMSAVELRAKFMDILETERKKRRHLRYLLKGFQEPPARTLDDEEEEEEKVDPEEADPDIQEEDEEFNREKHEQDIMKSLLPGLE